MSSRDGCCDKRAGRKPSPPQQQQLEQQHQKQRVKHEPKPTTAPACPEDAYSLDACVVQASRYDMCVAQTGAATLERVWIMSRPPGLRRGVSPTVSARRASVTLDNVMGQVMLPGEVMCKKVCTDDGDGSGSGGGGSGGGSGGGGGSGAGNGNNTRNTDRAAKQGSSCPRGRTCK